MYNGRLLNGIIVGALMGIMPLSVAAENVNGNMPLGEIRNIYTATAQEGVSQEEFVRRWRHYGGERMYEPDLWKHIQKYTQADAVLDRAAFAGNDTEIDGIGASYFNSIEELNEVLKYSSAKAPDEESIAFFRETTRMVAIKDNFIRVPDHVQPIRVYAFTNVNEDLTGMAGLERWNAWLLETLADDEFPEIVTGKKIFEESTFDLVTEFGFSNLEDAKIGLDKWQSVIKADSIGNAISDATYVVAKQIILYDREDYRTAE